MLNAKKTIAVATLIAAIAAPVRADLNYLFSIDWTSDVLYLINVNTGTTSAVGALNYDVNGGGDMTYFNDRLYHITSDAVDGSTSTHTLLEIDPASANVISSHQITLGGTPNVGPVEGLTVKDGELIVSYNNGTSPFARSNAIGQLSLSGEITNAIDFQTPYDADMDGLATDEFGQMYASDSVTQSDSVFFYQVDLAPQDYQLIGGFTGPTGSTPRANDIAFLDDRFFGIDHANDIFREINPATGQVITQFSLSNAYDFSGLATPEPGTLSFTLIATALMLRRRTR